MVMVQAKVAQATGPALSVTMSATSDKPAVVGTPVMMPLAELIESPAGNPKAAYVRTAVGDESEVTIGRGAMAVPEVSDWAPGAVTEMVLVIVQEKLT